MPKLKLNIGAPPKEYKKGDIIPFEMVKKCYLYDRRDLTHNSSWAAQLYSEAAGIANSDFVVYESIIVGDELYLSGQGAAAMFWGADNLVIKYSDIKNSL